ncbi:MAG: tetratricopeptide repeat protein [bacterium]
MKRIRVSIPLLIFIFLIASFGFLTYYNWNTHQKMKEVSNQINQKRIMDKLNSRLNLTKNYDILFSDIIKEEEYISNLYAYNPQGEKLSSNNENNIIDESEKYNDLFTKAVKSIGATKPFITEDKKYLFMRINPDYYDNTGDELIVIGEISTGKETLINRYFLLILNGAIGLATILFLIIFSLIFIGVGFSPLRNFYPEIPFAIHKGKTNTIEFNKGDSEVRDTIEVFNHTAEENNKVRKILNTLSDDNNTEEDITKTLFNIMKEDGFKSIVILTKQNSNISTDTYYGEWENIQDIENFTVNEDEAQEHSLLFSRLIKEKTYAEISENNYTEYEDVDIDIFGKSSIYFPILLNNETTAVIGGGIEKLNNQNKRIYWILCSVWGKILYKLISQSLNNKKETKTAFYEKNKINKKNKKDKKDKPLFKKDKKTIINKMNEATENYNKIYKEGVKLGKEKKYEEALDKLLPLLDIKREAHLLKIIGTCYYNLKDYQNAIKFWEETIENNPYDESVKKFLKKAYNKL